MSKAQAQVPESGEKWHIIYPQYLNSELTIQRGRRLPKSKCIPSPNWKEITDVLFMETGKFDVEAHPGRSYCRELDKELWMNRGYIRYRCKDDSFKNKRELLTFIAGKIQQLPIRQHPDWPKNVVDPMEELAHKQFAAQQQQQQAQGSGQTSGGGGGGGGGRKKKGRR